MILGLFSGKSVVTVRRRIEKLQTEQVSIRDTIQAAISDRAAAIRELQEDIQTFATLKSQI